MKYIVELPIKIPNTRGLDEFEEKRPKFVLEEDFVVVVNGDVNIIPAGFKYDNASVPWGLWDIFPPYHPDYAAAAAFHDLMYQAELFDRKVHDDLFLATMVAAGANKAKRNIMYFAVRTGGGFTYKKHTFETVMRARKLLGITSTLRPLFPEYRKGVFPTFK